MPVTLRTRTKARGPGAVWFFPPSYAIHLVEEYAGEGFTGWAERTLGLPLEPAEFVAWNAVGFGLLSLGTVLVWRHARYRWIEIAMSVAILGNSGAHLVASLLTQTYSPGLFSATLVWLPFGGVRLRSAHQQTGARGRRAGYVVGAIAIAVTFGVMAVSALFR